MGPSTRTVSHLGMLYSSSKAIRLPRTIWKEAEVHLFFGSTILSRFTVLRFSTLMGLMLYRPRYVSFLGEKLKIGHSTSNIFLQLYIVDGTTKYIYTNPTGDNGVATVRVQTENVMEVRISFPQGGAVAQMDYTMCSLIPTPAPTYSPTCPDVDLDFNLLLPGSYIGDQLWEEYGIKFATESVGGGFRPNNTARVFDTSNPGNKTHGSPDIGSPNESCGGPGIGQGGNLASRYENCAPLGNVLIIQSSSKNPVPQYYKNSTKFKAYFKVASFVESITMVVGTGCKQMKFTVRHRHECKSSIVVSPHSNPLNLCLTDHPRPLQGNHHLWSRAC